MSARYVHRIQTFFTQDLTNFLQVNESHLFPKDGANSQTAKNSVNTISQLFPDDVISRNGDISLPARSPDLSACDSALGANLRVKFIIIAEIILPK
jgi:hypothetical protein